MMSEMHRAGTCSALHKSQSRSPVSEPETSPGSEHLDFKAHKAAVLKLSRGSIVKLFLSWRVTCHICKWSDTAELSSSISRDGLCPEDKLQWWISIIDSLLHSCFQSGGLPPKANSSWICSHKLSIFQTSSPQQPTVTPFFFEKKKTFSLPLKWCCKVLPQQVYLWSYWYPPPPQLGKHVNTEIYFNKYEFHLLMQTPFCHWGLSSWDVSW